MKAVSMGKLSFDLRKVLINVRSALRNFKIEGFRWPCISRSFRL